MKNKYVLLTGVVLCFLLLGACGSGNASVSGTESASASVVSSTAGSSAPASSVVSAAVKEDFIPAFFGGRDTASVSYDPTVTGQVPGIQFLFNPDNYDMEISVSEGTIYDMNAQSPNQGQDYKFRSGPKSSIYWLPAESDGTPAASAEITFTVYQNGAPAVQGVVDMMRLGDSYQYLALLTQINNV